MLLSLQDSILSAIDTLVNNRIDKIQADKTITGSVLACTNALTGEYRISYNGGQLLAYAQEGVTYTQNQSVYVLVPEGDFTKKKTIISKTQALENDENISFVSSALSNYNLIGKNPISDEENILPAGMRSYLKNNYIFLYQYGMESTAENPLLSIDIQEMTNNIKEAEAVLIEASFLTRLPKLHRLTKTGYYGIQFVLAFQDSDETDNEYNVSLPIVDENGDLELDIEKIEAHQNTLEYYKSLISDIWASADLTLEEKTAKTNTILESLKEITKNMTSVGDETITDFVNKLQGISSEKDVNTVFTDLEETGKTVPAIKKLSYVIDNNNMTGNPFLFTTWSDQYAIYPIDTENFLYIDSIMAFAQDFVEEDDSKNAELWGDDIFVKDIEFYGLKTITATNGDYKLSLSMPLGSTFKSILAADNLEVVGKVTKLNTLLSDSTMFYWFAEDGRITSSSEEYQMYGGAGWRYLKDKGNNYTLTTYGNENRAYENKYLCVAVYKEEVILKEYFTIYNEAARRNLSISSSLGIKFSFDRGIPTLTCLVDGKSESFEAGQVNGHPDSYFRFIWSKQDMYGQVTTFSQTKEELDAAYQQGLKDGWSYSELSALRNQIQELEGVIFTPGDNELTYPVKQIDATATFKCSVYLKDTADGEEYNIGSAEIVLHNEGVASPTDYYILIENGDQVFQYSESGVSPDDSRYTDPLEIKPLICHFYDPAGLEVNKETYEIKWKVPLSDTLIVAPKEGMILNPATELVEWSTSEDYPLKIAANYDYQALNNQITAIVTYQGQEYTQDTTFLFTKVGENGTNGTDIVAKVYPIEEDALNDKDELLTLELVGGIADSWNTGQLPSATVLGFSLYQRNEELTIDDVSWTISGGASTKSKYASSTNGNFTWTTEKAVSGMFRNQIVRASTRLDGNDYYAFYPVPVVDYSAATGKTYHVSIDATRTLKSITYNADGRNPLYNKNQGIFISLGDLNERDLSNKYIVWYAEGGQPTKVAGGYADNPMNAAFTLTYEKNSADGLSVLVPRDNDDGAWEILTQLYILPNDVYDGAYCNNLVHGKIYSSRDVYENKGNAEVDIYIPIYISLNTYGLKSLNAWDGNHVEINEDENYILAPQIGAGSKDSENKFTGVVMGKTQTYDANEASVGLLGYSHGKQSIWLDAETGNATFGLPEDQATQNNEFTEGRIELIPGGDSKIGMWTIGSRALFNISDPLTGGKVQDGSEIEDVNGTAREKTIENGVGEPYLNYAVDGAQISVPHTAQGIILNTNPAYFSIKGMPLTEDNDSIEWGAANTTIMPGDSLEVEIDPRKSSVFSIYRHTTYDGNNDTGKWRRYPLVGINSNGQFYTNAIEDGESSMGIGVIGAFKHPAAAQKYVGAQFAWRGKNLFKFYVDTEDSESEENKKLYISTGSTVDYETSTGGIRKGDEYPREIGIYGNGVTLYAPSNGKTNETDSDHKISIKSDSAFFGHTDSYINIPFLSDESAEINLKSQLDITTPSDRRTNLSTGGLTVSTTGTSEDADINIVGRNDLTLAITRDTSLTTGQYFNVTGKDFRLRSYLTEKKSVREFEVSSTNNESYIKLHPAAERSALHSDTGWNFTSKTGGIQIKTTNSSEGIYLDSVPPNGIANQGTYLHLGAQDGGGSDFYLNSPHGSVRSMTLNLDAVSGNTKYNTIQIAPGFSTDWGQFVGSISGTSDSIWAKNNIKSASGNMYAKDHIFNSSKSWSSVYNNAGNSKKYSSTSIEQHLEYLYSLVSAAYTRANSAYTHATNVNNEVRSWANNRFALAGHTHSNYVTEGEYITHTHSVTHSKRGYGRYELSTGGLYTDIDGSAKDGFVVYDILGTGFPK